MRELHVTSPFMQGADVLAVQTKLKLLGYAPGALDGQYGPTTYRAVKEFQHDHKIAVDGIVGTVTSAVLNGAIRPKPPVQSETIGLSMLAEAVKWIGTKETPSGSNNVSFNRWFYDLRDGDAARNWTQGHPGPPWCNVFLSFCAIAGANIVLCKGASGPGTIEGKGCAYVPTTESWLKATGHWNGKLQPMDGDIACFNWNGGDPDHIGFTALETTLRRLCPSQLATAIRDYGPIGIDEFWTVEGNTAVGNDSNGGEVMLRQRVLTLIDGFGRLA